MRMEKRWGGGAAPCDSPPADVRSTVLSCARGRNRAGSPRAPRRGDGEGSSGSMSGSAGGKSGMKSRRMRQVVVAGTLLLSLLAAGGCRKQEPPRGTGGEAINLHALHEMQTH